MFVFITQLLSRFRNSDCSPLEEGGIRAAIIAEYLHGSNLYEELSGPASSSGIVTSQGYCNVLNKLVDMEGLWVKKSKIKMYGTHPSLQMSHVLLYVKYT